MQLAPEVEATIRKLNGLIEKEVGGKPPHERAELHKTRGLLLKMAGDLHEALEEFEHAREADPRIDVKQHIHDLRRRLGLDHMIPFQFGDGRA